MKLTDFSNKLSTLLDIERYTGADVSLNGLQVGRRCRDIKKVAFAVDASLATIKEAAKQKADVLFTHHGLFWGKPIAIIGRHYDRVKALLDNDLALFACHLPLDANMELGNNAQMGKALELRDMGPFSLFRGVYVGVKGSLPKPMTADDIVRKLGVRRNNTQFFINGDDKVFRTVGIVSGEGASDVYQAMDENLDVLITGESQYSTVNDCIEDGMSMMCLGHYETETFGVKAVMEYVKANMGLETCFVDMPLGL